MIDIDKIARYSEFIEGDYPNYCNYRIVGIDDPDVEDDDELLEDWTAYLPDGLWTDEDGLYRLPDGRYLPAGYYEIRGDDDRHMVYEPAALTYWDDLLDLVKEV